VKCHLRLSGNRQPNLSNTQYFKMESLLPAIQGWFTDKREHLIAFANSDCRLEGWFKGELLVLFGQLRQVGSIAEFEREVNVPLTMPGKRFQIDFRIRLGAESHLCELKALCISQAAGTPRNLNFYFRDDHVGLIKDIKKLELVPETNRWLLAFVYPAPSPEAWDRAVRSVPVAFGHWRPINRPMDTNAPLFVSLWRCESAVT